MWTLGERGVYEVRIEDYEDFFNDPVSYLESGMAGDMLVDFEEIDCD